MMWGRAVILHADELGVDKPVAYFSKMLNKHQWYNSTVEKEALAFVLAGEHFEMYVSNSMEDLIVLTDHNPLVFHERMRTENPRLFRLHLIL